MNHKTTGLIVIVIIIVCSLAAVVALSMLAPAQPNQTPTEELNFNVSGSSNCLRFLNDSVPIVYVPFTVAANEQMQLTVNATKMPGGANGWTDVYIYNGYWNQGADHMCKSGDVYPIISDIQSADFAIQTKAPYTATFRDTTQKSYTVFFVLPLGGEASFHITLKLT